MLGRGKLAELEILKGGKVMSGMWMGGVGAGKNVGRVFFFGKKRAKLVYEGMIEIHSRGGVGSRARKEMMGKGEVD